MSRFQQAVVKAGWRLPLINAISSRQPVILLYHDVPAEGDGTQVDGKVFERHIRFLRKHFELVSHYDLGKSRSVLDRIRVLLTFDDGFRNNAEVVAPILRRYNVPAMFFVCSRHATPGKYLWFSYLRALERHFPGDGFYFRSEFMDMSASRRRDTVHRLRETLLGLTPHPAGMYQAIDEELPRLEDFLDRDEFLGRYAGMTAAHVRELAADPLFRVGAHTADHPFLTRCEPAEAVRQMDANRTWIERVACTACDAIAYPSGNYDTDVLDRCQRLRFSQGYAVNQLVNGRPELQRTRIGIYSTSLDILGFKVQWGSLMRSLRIGVG